MSSIGLRRRRSRILSLAGMLAVFLGGCAHPGAARAPAVPPIPAYVMPEGPTARLLMRGTLQPGETYGVYLYGDGANCTGLQRVGMGVQGRDPAASALGTDNVKTLQVFFTKPNKTICQVRWSFAPRVGHVYAVYANTTATGCSANVLDASNPDAMKLEASLKRRDVPGNLCVPMAQAKGVTVATGSAPLTESDLPLPSTSRPGGTDPAADLGGLITP